MKKTAKKLSAEIAHWEDVHAKWDKKGKERPNDPMTQASAKCLKILSNDEIAKMRAKRSSLIGKKCPRTRTVK